MSGFLKIRLRTGEEWEDSLEERFPVLAEVSSQDVSVPVPRTIQDAIAEIC